MNRTERAQVLYLDHAPILGGAEIVLLNLLDTLNRERFTPIVATTATSPWLDALRERAIETVFLPFERLNEAGMAMPLHLASSVLALTRLLRRCHVTLLHTNTARAHIVGSLAGALTRTPIVWTLHDNTLPIAWARRLGRFPRRIIAVSKWLSDWYAPAGLAHKTMIVPNGISLHVPGDAPGLRAELGIARDAPLVVNAGRLVERKAPHVFVLAAQRVARVVPAAYFVLVGGPDELEPGHRPPEYLARLERVVNTSNLGEHLRLVGKRGDVARFFAAADLVVHCVIEPEGFGMVLVEAMRAGKPVIASQIGAAPEVVQDGTTGVLVPPGDVTALTSTMILLLQDRTRAREMGLAGRARLEREFDLRVQVSKIEEIYAKCLN